MAEDNGAQREKMVQQAEKMLERLAEQLAVTAAIDAVMGDGSLDDLNSNPDGAAPVDLLSRYDELSALVRRADAVGVGVGSLGDDASEEGKSVSQKRSHAAPCAYHTPVGLKSPSPSPQNLVDEHGVGSCVCPPFGAPRLHGAFGHFRGRDSCRGSS